MTRRRVAVMLHGSGSDAAFTRAAFSPGALGVDAVLTPQLRTGDVTEVEAALAAEVHRARSLGDDVAVAGGVSLGAHAAARWAAGGGSVSRGLALVMPAWTGAPDAVAAATAAAADEVRALGSAAILARLRGAMEAATEGEIEGEIEGDWVLDALTAAWPGYGDDALAEALAASGRSPGPTEQMLRRLTTPCAVVALLDDPLHPQAVARQWASLLPRATLRTLPRDLGGRGPSALGAAAGEALAELSGSR